MPTGTRSEPERATRRRAIVRVLIATMLANYAVAALKLAYAHHTNALAFSADGIHSLLDGSANIVGLVGVRAASAPADEGHPYGHQRYEAITALAIGGLILAGLYTIVAHAVNAFMDGGPHEGGGGPGGLAIALITFVANLGVSWFERRRGLALRSSVLVADAGHTASDALSTLVLAGASVGAWAGLRWADPVAAIVIGGIIARAAWMILKENIDVLADARRVDPDVVRTLACDVDGIRGAHKVRSRGTLDHVAVDLHIHVDPRLTVEEAHRLTHRVADRIRERMPDVHDVVIHTEPADGREKA